MLRRGRRPRGKWRHVEEVKVSQGLRAALAAEDGEEGAQERGRVLGPTAGRVSHGEPGGKSGADVYNVDAGGGRGKEGSCA